MNSRLKTIMMGIALAVAAVLVWALGFWGGPVQEKQSTPEPPVATISGMGNPVSTKAKSSDAFTWLYNQIGYVPENAGVIFLQPSAIGERMVVVENYPDAPQVYLYTHISAAEAADIRDALKKGYDLELFMLSKLKHFKMAEFIDWGRDGFAQRDYGNGYMDKFLFGEGGIELGGKRVELVSVSALELDASDLNRVNAVLLYTLQESMPIYREKRSAREAEKSNDTSGRVKAARGAIEELSQL